MAAAAQSSIDLGDEGGSGSSGSSVSMAGGSRNSSELEGTTNEQIMAMLDQVRMQEGRNGWRAGMRSVMGESVMLSKQLHNIFMCTLSSDSFG